MSVIVKGMEMPKEESITIQILPSGAVYLEDKLVYEACAVDIPTPHGRLIAEKTITEIRYHDADGYHIVNGEQLCELEIDAETVIEAEGETDGR